MALACSASDLTYGGAIDAAIALPDAAAIDAGKAHDAATPSSGTYVRLAQMSPDVGGVDFCVKTKLEVLGPLALLAAPDGGADAGAFAINFGEVSRYLNVKASGTVDIIVVSAGATDCSTPRAIGTVTLDAGKHATIVLMGVAKGTVSPARALGISAFVDESMSDSSLVRMRVVHAALGTAQSLGVGPLGAALTDGNNITRIADEVLPRKASTPSGTDPVVDSLGYHALAIAPKSPTSVRVSYGDDAGVSVWTSLPVELSLMPGSARTVFVVSPYPYGKVQGLGVFVCDDVDHGWATACVFAAAY